MNQAVNLPKAINNEFEAKFSGTKIKSPKKANISPTYKIFDEVPQTRKFEIELHALESKDSQKSLEARYSTLKDDI